MSTEAQLRQERNELAAALRRVWDNRYPAPVVLLDSEANLLRRIEALLGEEEK